MGNANVDINPVDGSITMAYSRADLVAGSWTGGSTDGNGFTPLFPHGLGVVPIFATMVVTFPIGGGNNIVGPWQLSICDATNLQFRMFANDGNLTGTVRASKPTNILWWAVAP